MRTPVQALLWELWRLSRWDMAVRVVSTTALWGVLCYYLESFPDQPGGSVQPAFLTIVVLMGTAIMSLFLSSWMSGFDNKQNGFGFCLGFTRPISTPLMVAVPMTYFAFSTAVCYLVPAALLRAWFGLPLPMLPMAAALATVTVALVMAVWSSQIFAARVIAFFGVLGVFLFVVPAIWLKRHPGAFDAFFSSPASVATAFSFPLGGYAVMALIFVCSIAITVFAVDRQRHGELISLKAAALKFDLCATILPERARSFGGPARAQFWLEARSAGLPLLYFALATAVFFFVLAVSIFDSSSHHDSPNPILIFWTVILALCPLGFILIGAEWSLKLRRKQGAVWLSTFEATQAMGNTGLVCTKLVALTASVLLSWFVVALAAIVWSLTWGDHASWIREGREIGPFVAGIPGYCWVCAAVILAVSFVTACLLAMSLGWFAPLHLQMLGMIPLAMLCYCVIFIVGGGNHWHMRPFWEANAWLWAAGLVVAALVVLLKALGQGYLPKKHFKVTLCLWLVYVGAALAVYHRFLPGNIAAALPYSVMALGLALLTIPLMAVGLTPLALAAHRHR